MSEYTLAAQKRSITGKKVSQLRTKGLVPGTLYGPKVTPVNVQFPYRPLQVALMKAGGTQIIDIEVEGDKIYPVLAREVQRDIIRGDILHVDFFVLDMKVRVRAEIPVMIIGESPLVTARKGILLTGPTSLTIETLPNNLMDKIEIDVSSLKEFGATISVADVNLGPEVTILNEPEEMVARVIQAAAARSAERSQDGGEGEDNS